MMPWAVRYYFAPLCSVWRRSMIWSHLEWSAPKVTTCSFVELTSLRTVRHHICILRLLLCVFSLIRHKFITACLWWSTIPFIEKSFHIIYDIHHAILCSSVIPISSWWREIPVLKLVQDSRIFWPIQHYRKSNTCNDNHQFALLAPYCYLTSHTTDSYLSNWRVSSL